VQAFFVYFTQGHWSIAFTIFTINAIARVLEDYVAGFICTLFYAAPRQAKQYFERNFGTYNTMEIALLILSSNINCTLQMLVPKPKNKRAL